MGHDASGDHAHPAHLAHHFQTPAQQFYAAKLGMWVFLATEVLLFSGMFCAYAIYRATHPEIFEYAHHYLDKVLGGINTIILICSSLTMAWAVHAAQHSNRRLLIIMLALTLVFACGFLGIKYVEYQHKWKEGLLWGQRFDPAHPPGVNPHAEDAGHQTAGADHESHDREGADQPDHSGAVTLPRATAQSPAEADTQPAAEVERSTMARPGQAPTGLAEKPYSEDGDHHILDRPPNVHIFFGIYFAMTGLHGLHVLAGMSVIGWILVRSIKGHFSSEYFTPVDLTGLYWHLVDLIWIYLFPLLYLIH